MSVIKVLRTHLQTPLFHKIFGSPKTSPIEPVLLWLLVGQRNLDITRLGRPVKPFTDLCPLAHLTVILVPRWLSPFSPPPRFALRCNVCHRLASRRPMIRADHGTPHYTLGTRYMYSSEARILRRFDTSSPTSSGIPMGRHGRS